MYLCLYQNGLPCPALRRTYITLLLPQRESSFYIPRKNLFPFPSSRPSSCLVFCRLPLPSLFDFLSSGSSVQAPYTRHQDCSACQREPLRGFCISVLLVPVFLADRRKGFAVFCILLEISDHGELLCRYPVRGRGALREGEDYPLSTCKWTARA